MFTLLGWISVGLGLIGILVPVLPTVPFMILAAFLFARGSPKARAWLMAHRGFGPHIAAWEQRGGIARPAKLWAAGTMAAVMAVSLALSVPGWVLAVQAVCLGAAAAYVLSRPD